MIDYVVANGAGVESLLAAAADGTAFDSTFTNGTDALSRGCDAVSPPAWVCRSVLGLPGRTNVAVRVAECLPKSCSSYGDVAKLEVGTDVAFGNILKTDLVRRGLDCPQGGLLSTTQAVALCVATVTVCVGALVVLLAFCTRWPRPSLKLPARTPSKPASGKPWWTAWDVRANLKSLWAPGRLAPLDGLRSCAVLWVVAFHTTIELNPTSYESRTWSLVAAGDMGVDIFFALSGFLMAYVLLGRTPGVRDGRPWSGFMDGVAGVRPLRFWFRRWVRLMPAYVVAIVASAATTVPELAHGCRKRWYLNVLFVNNLVPPGVSTNACLIQSWSIAVEAQFYVLSPFVVVAMWKWPWVTGVSLATASTLIRGWILLALAGTERNFVHNTETYEGVYTPLYTRVAPYVFGMLACVLAKKLAQPRKASAEVPLMESTRVRESLVPATHAAAPPTLRCWQLEALAVVSMAVWGALSWLGCLGSNLTARNWNLDYGWRMFAVLVLARGVFGAAVSTMVYLMLRDGRKSYVASAVSWLLSLRVHAPIARLSYATYLLQFLVFSDQWFGPKQQPFKLHGDDSVASFFKTVLQIGCILVQANFFAFLTYMVVEKPALNLRG